MIKGACPTNGQAPFFYLQSSISRSGILDMCLRLFVTRNRPGLFVLSLFHEIVMLHPEFEKRVKEEWFAKGIVGNDFLLLECALDSENVG